MADAEDVIEILSSEEAEEEGSAEMSQSDGSDDYCYDSSEDDGSDALGDEPRPVSTTDKKAPYRIIDSEVLKQVQVRSCTMRQWVWGWGC